MSSQAFGEAVPSTASPARERVMPALLRFVPAAVGCVAAVLMVLRQTWYRGTEAMLAGELVSKWLGYSVTVSRPRQAMFFAFHGTGPAHMLGLQVTLGCSSVLLIAPLVLFGGLMMSMSNAAPFKIILATALASILLLGANVLRLVMIAAMVNGWGVDVGFGWGHTLFGSLLMLTGMAGAVIIYVLILRRWRRPRAQTA